MKENFVAFINKQIKEDFESLKNGKFEDKKLAQFIEKTIENLKINPGCGTKIPKSIWPPIYLKDYQITNLWKCDLPGAWRLIYTLDTNETRIVAFIIEWFDHKNYEKRFNY